MNPHIAMNRRSLCQHLLACAAAPLAAIAPLTAFAQGTAGYPARPITLVVGYPAGGDSDVLARFLGEKLSARLGQPVVVDNRTGAAGTIAVNYVSKAPPDGYTLLLAPNTLAITPHVLQTSRTAQVDPATDLTPIIQLASQSLFVVVASDTGVKAMKELLASVKAGRIRSYASPGYGSPMHILAELVDKSAGVKITQVPYRGSMPAIADMVAGQVPMMYTSLGPVAPYIDSGKLTVLAVADAQRSPFLPQVPTLAEAGVPHAEIGAWQALLGPKGLPPALVALLNQHFNEIIRMPDVVARMKSISLQPEGGPPDRMKKLAEDDYLRYGRLVKEFGIRAE